MVLPLQFVDTNGEKLLETFPVRSRRLRPKPPAAAQLEKLSDYEVCGAVLSCAAVKMDLSN